MDPFPKERPRVVRMGKGRNAKSRAIYTKRYTDNKDLCKELVGNFRLKKDAHLSMSLICYRKVPASWTEAKRKEMAGTWTHAGGDADNLAGGVMDAIFPDDKMVVKLNVERRWSDRKDRQGYMKLEVREIKE